MNVTRRTFQVEYYELDGTGVVANLEIISNDSACLKANPIGHSQWRRQLNFLPRQKVSVYKLLDELSTNPSWPGLVLSMTAKPSVRVRWSSAS